MKTKCLAVWFQIKPNSLSGLIWVYIVCKVYQQMARAGKHTYNDKSPVLWAITFSIDYGQKNPFPFTFIKSTVGQAVHEAHTIIICMLGNFFRLFSSADLFQNQLSRKKSFRNTIKVSTVLIQIRPAVLFL